jgi:hypothetical protein
MCIVSKRLEDFVQVFNKCTYCYNKRIPSINYPKVDLKEVDDANFSYYIDYSIDLKLYAMLQYH